MGIWFNECLNISPEAMSPLRLELSISVLGIFSANVGLGNRDIYSWLFLSHHAPIPAVSCRWSCDSLATHLGT